VPLQCRVEKNRLVIIDDKGKEQKCTVIGVTQAKQARRVKVDPDAAQILGAASH
jgi:hypothetical protein